MNEFEFYCPAKIEFGVGSIEALSSYLEMLNVSHPVVVTDKMLHGTPAVSKVIADTKLDDVFDDIAPNPTDEMVMALAAFAEAKHADSFVVFGGGSSMDCAKGASVVSYTGHHVKEYYDFAVNQRPIEKTLPIVAVPTTAGTGSEVSKYAVITESDTNVKKCLTSDLIVPKIAVIDPTMTAGMPPKVTVSTGLDALSHALESLLSKIENPLTNALAFRAIQLVFENLNQARLHGDDLDARSNMSFAALLAGMAMSHCCGTMCHAMGCQITSQYHVPHGLACAVLQKHGLDYAGEKAENIRALVRYLDHKDCIPEQAVAIMQKKLDDLFASLETDMDLKSCNMTDEGIDIMTRDAMEHGCMSLNPVEMAPAEVKKVFQKLK